MFGFSTIDLKGAARSRTWVALRLAHGFAQCRSRQHVEDVLQLGHPLSRARAALNIGEREGPLAQLPQHR
jgi:hypothetical protein